jgi:hypothetical protein
MADDNNELPLDVEAQMEATEPESTPRRGFASLRGTKRSNYMRRSVLRMLSKAPEELEAYSPANGFEMIAKNLVTAKGKDGVIAVQVWREVKETLGERIGSRWKDTVEERERKNAPTIINTIPCADLPPLKDDEDEKPN